MIEPNMALLGQTETEIQVLFEKLESAQQQAQRAGRPGAFDNTRLFDYLLSIYRELDAKQSWLIKQRLALLSVIDTHIFESEKGLERLKDEVELCDNLIELIKKRSFEIKN